MPELQYLMKKKYIPIMHLGKDMTYPKLRTKCFSMRPYKSYSLLYGQVSGTWWDTVGTSGILCVFSVVVRALIGKKVTHGQTYMLLLF